MTSGLPPPATDPPRTVRIGGQTRAELLRRLESQGVRLNAYARRLFQDDRFSTAPTARDVEVVVATPSALGLPDGGTYAQVLNQARSRGMDAGPLELAAHLRLQWLHQPESEPAAGSGRHQAPLGAVTVASNAPPDALEIPWGFYLRRLEGEPWLRGYVSWSGHRWQADDRFAWVRLPPAAGAETTERRVPWTN